MDDETPTLWGISHKLMAGIGISPRWSCLFIVVIRSFPGHVKPIKADFSRLALLGKSTRSPRMAEMAEMAGMVARLID
jgi:hypothetical protein